MDCKICCKARGNISLFEKQYTVAIHSRSVAMIRKTQSRAMCETRNGTESIYFPTDSNNKNNNNIC